VLAHSLGVSSASVTKSGYSPGIVAPGVEDAVCASKINKVWGTIVSSDPKVFFCDAEVVKLGARFPQKVQENNGIGGKLI
jgi:hypothetical protein